MSTPTRDSIESFKSITGASESVALRKLEEYGGNLNAAVSAHFLELERSITNPTYAVSSQNNSVDMNNQNGVGMRGIVPFISAVRRFRPSLLLDANYRRNLFNWSGASNFNHHVTSPHMGEVTGVPVGFNSGNEHPLHSGVRPAITDSTGPPSNYGGGIYGNVSSDDHQHQNDIECEMMQAAIEASKQEFEQTHTNEQHGSSYDSSGAGLQQRRLQQEDDELARAISLSLKTADEEKAVRVLKDHYEQVGIYDSSARTQATTNNSLKAGNSSLRQLPVNHDSSHDTPPNRLRHSKDSFNSIEWGGISSEELDQAIMLETQLFSQIPEGASYRSSNLSHEQSSPGASVDPGPQALSRPQSFSLMEQRLLWQQQDDEYLASLLADKEKEMNALKKAESHSWKEEKSCRRKLGGKESEMSAKETSLPPEPATNDENAVTILVRLPDGTRHGRRFLKSDKLQLLFDFIDISKVVKPVTYRLVRPYPRHAFGANDCSLSLNQLGLTAKQEALFLEFI